MSELAEALGDIRALEEWAARAMWASRYGRLAFPHPSPRADVAALTPLLEVVAAARAWRHGDAGEADWPTTEAVIDAVDAFESAMGERSDG